MCPWVGPHAPSFGRQVWRLPSRVEYLSTQRVLLPLVYSTTVAPLWLQLRGHSAWQATPSWTVYRLASHALLPWLRVTFAMVPDAARPGSDQWPWSTAPSGGPVGWLGRPSASHPWGVGSFLSLGRPTCVRCPGPLDSCSPVCPRGLLCSPLHAFFLLPQKCSFYAAGFLNAVKGELFSYSYCEALQYNI